MSQLLAIHPDGTEVPLDHEAMAALLKAMRAWAALNPWSPLTETDDGTIHPQFMAYNSEADITGYGGAAGGGKTDLACGLAITRHRKVLMLRRVGTELLGIIDRLEELIGNKDGYNGQQKVWKRNRFDGVRQQIEFASLPNLGDERGFQGRPHDLIVYDEAANFLEAQVRFLLGWLRSTHKGQRKRALLTFNPPTSAEGQWIIEFFGPWLDDTHPNPALPGELRWFATIAGKDHEVPDNKPFVLHANLVQADPQRHFDREPDDRVYNYDPSAYRGKERTRIITPMSRTFIPSKITDNPYLFDTGYMAMLQALPEPLRSQMLNGDFKAGMVDDQWQVVPTAWVDLAQARWKQYAADHPGKKPGPMDSLGADIARGGKDNTVLAPRHGNWIGELIRHAGTETPDGDTAAAQIMLGRRDNAVIHIDAIGVGASPYDILRNQMKVQVVGVDVRMASVGTDQSGAMRFFNLRSELHWSLREWLDPSNNTGAMLPPGSRLRADITAARWGPQGRVIKVETKDDIKERIGRSPDESDAVMLALMATPKRDLVGGAHTRNKSRDYDPYANIRG